MKSKILLLLSAVACLSSCTKDSLFPNINQSLNNKNTIAAPSPAPVPPTTPTGAGQNPTAITTPGYLNIQLAQDANNVDGTIIGFKPNTTAAYVNSEDAIYFQGAGSVSLSSFSSDNIPLAVNLLPFPKTSLTINLNVNALTDGVYTLNMTAINAIPKLFEIWLMDGYKRDSLDFKNNATYAFNVNTSDVATYGRQRFSLVIRQNPALGIHLLNFTAVKASGGSQITWLVENEVDYTIFTAQRSTDGGQTYTDQVTLPSASASTYNFLDKTPAGGTDQYRLKIVNLNGTITYSKVISLDY
ncbi:MAG TPA: hypothetical protein VGN20_06315 [Mucilaginibacter sp.]|jgi:hypothetical protein